MLAFTLELDRLPPSANRLWRVGNGRAHMADKYRVWKDAAVSNLFAQARQQVRGEWIKGPYAMRVRCVKPDRRRRDISNNHDLCVTMGLVEDDCLCQSIRLEWRDGPPVADATATIFLIATKERSGE